MPLSVGSSGGVVGNHGLRIGIVVSAGRYRVAVAITVDAGFTGRMCGIESLSPDVTSSRLRTARDHDREAV